MSIAHLRKEYRQSELRRADLDPDPLRQFEKWLQIALQVGVPEPSAMALATADKQGRPSVRMVLLKGVDVRGFSFFTHYDSPKGRDLTQNPQAALVIYWAELERQIRVSGKVRQLDQAESAAYFNSRPKGSRLAAWVSPQSQVMPNRHVLEERFDQLRDQFPGENIPVPPTWGGYLLQPQELEFWQGRPNRLHDRFRYTRLSDQDWRIERLAP